MRMRTFVLGDLHGAYRALLQCLVRSGFDNDNDKLIFLGDIYDGWSEGPQCVDELMKIKNLVHILGNHDDWTLQWALTGEMPSIWLLQGGEATIESYNGKMPEHHIEFLKKAVLYHQIDNRLFLHAGFIPDVDIIRQSREILQWDRSFVESAVKFYMAGRKNNITKYKEIYLGHSPTIRYGMHYPTQFCEVWLMDTGAGWNGMLSIMDIDSKEYWCSDNVIELYPDEKGRFS